MKVVSKYTTQVRWIVEYATPSMEGQPIYNRIKAAAPAIFNFDYPIWTEEHRVQLETKILTHYFNKEIALETVGLWKLYLCERLNLIMPYYIELYESTQRKYDYLTTIDFTETYTATKTEEETGKMDTTNNAETSMDDTIDTTTSADSLRSDLPQANYAGLDYGTNSQTDSGTSKSDSTSTGTSKSTGNATNTVNRDVNDNYTRTRKGTDGSRSITELLEQYRKSILNIDREIVNELYDLFMLIY